MKKLLIFAIPVIIFTSCTNRVTLVKDSAYQFNILIGKDADSLTLKSAEKLRIYLGKISGTEISVVNQPSESGKYISLGLEALNDTADISDIKKLKDDGFIIRIRKENITLAGKTGESDMFAVSTFLEEYLGCMKFTGTEELVPTESKIKLKISSKSYQPAFTFRHPYFMDRLNNDFLEWHKLNNFDDWGLYVHTFQKLLPPSKYFEKHPEYYSLVNGKRIQDGQLCLSNPEVIKLLGDNLAGLIALQPEKTYWSVSQNDCINYCECDNCRKLYTKYGNISGVYIEMANAIAERFPDKQISTLAYQFTRQAPANIIPRENVNIMFCSIECNRSMPLADDPRSAGFVTDMKAWEKISSNIFIWDYVVQFKTYLCPFPNFQVLQPNIQFFRDHNGKMMFQQGSGNGWSDLCELKQYLITKLLWNPDINADSVMTRFIDMYYGPASEFIKSYQKLAEKTMVSSQDKWNLDIYGLPSFYFKTYLTKPLLTEYENLMDKAELAVKTQPDFLARVQKTRCAVDFAYLDYALNAGDSTISFIIQKDGKQILNKKVMLILNNFMGNTLINGITHIGEEKLTVKEYRDHIMRILNMALIENKAKGKEIKSLTAFNPRYLNPGVKRLNDGIFGGRHFNSGWLGYEGTDMVVEIDLGKNDSLKKVSMNFLRDFVSWVFLPDEVRVELSSDGKIYNKVAAITNTLTDRRFGVEPVYHSLEFVPAYSRFVRISAISMKKCPEWHRGAGQPSWVFCDEIIIE